MVTGETQHSRKKRAANYETFFAPPERASRVAFRKSVDLITSNPIVDTLLGTVAGLIAVLNKHRQILALNTALLDLLGIDDAQQVLGLRPGEAIGCVHAHDNPGGCGTSRHCATCGAAIAIVTSLATNEPQERTCVAQVTRNGKETDLFLRVRCCPATFDRERFMLLFLQDSTVQQQQAVLEQAFFHDIQNMVSALKLNSHLLDSRQDPAQRERIVSSISQIADQLHREIGIQQLLTTGDSHTLSVLMKRLDVGKLVNELLTALSNHPASQDKTISIPEPIPAIKVNSDLTLLKRVLANMVINAYEATAPGGTVRFWVEQTEKDVSFLVWNAQVIALEQSLRIFQRNYSTKADSGRGLGTYSMKLLGENYLGGKVDFVSSDAEGTTFRLSLPAAV